MKIKGTAWKFGDNVDTDAILPARYLNTSDPQELAEHCMEDADAEFTCKMTPGDLIVAGRNFGCGSSREHAPIAIKHAGVGAVIAHSYARIFFRNAFNMGLTIIESPEAAEKIEPGDQVEVDLEKGLIENLTKNEQYQAQPIPPFMRVLVESGGLVPYVKQKLSKEASHV